MRRNLVVLDKKVQESDPLLDTYLNDFYGFYNYIINDLDIPEDNIMGSLLESLNNLLKCKLQTLYEKEILARDKIPAKHIMKDNKAFLEEIKKEIERYNSKERLSYLDCTNVYTMNKIYEKYSGNVVEGTFYYSSDQEQLITYQPIFLDQVQEVLKAKGVLLSKKRKFENKLPINTRLAKTYYDVICDKTLQLKFLMALEDRSTLDDPRLIELFNNVSENRLKDFARKTIKRDLITESCLVMYIVCSSIDRLNAQDIEKHYSENEVEGFSYNAMSEVEEETDNMYLRRRFNR